MDLKTRNLIIAVFVILECWINFFIFMYPPNEVLDFIFLFFSIIVTIVIILLIVFKQIRGMK